MQAFDKVVTLHKTSGISYYNWIKAFSNKLMLDKHDVTVDIIIMTKSRRVRYLNLYQRPSVMHI